MKLNSVTPADGYTWIRQGIWLFKQSPVGFLMLVFMYVFVAQLAVLVPVTMVGTTRLATGLEPTFSSSSLPDPSLDRPRLRKFFGIGIEILFQAEA